LNKISDPTNSTEVLDYLVKNGDLLFFFIQQFPSIEKIVKEQFNGGIKAPLLISLIFKRFTTQQEESLLPDSEDFEVVQNVLTREDIATLIQNTQGARIKAELRKLDIDNLPLKADILRITRDPVKYQTELKAYADQYRNGLSREDLNKIIETANDAPIQETNQATLDAERELFEKVNNFLASTSSGSKLQISPETLPIDKPIKSRSSLARTIPKAPITQIAELKTSDIKRAEKANISEKIAKKNQSNILAELQKKSLQQKSQSKEAQKQSQKEAKRLAKLQSDLILQSARNPKKLTKAQQKQEEDFFF